MPKVILKEVVKDIFHLEFPTPYLAGATLMRFQEYYESPKFHGKIFTLEEYMDYYAAKHGGFTYCEDFIGYNFPSETLIPFYEGKFDPLSVKESKILEAFLGKTEYYVIATASNSSSRYDDFIHELGHGLFRIDSEYREKVKKILSEVDLKPIYEYLKDAEYCRSQFLDEAHAVLLEEAMSFRRTGLKAQDYSVARKALRRIYMEHRKLIKSETQTIKL
jgi:hypothetical protein